MSKVKTFFTKITNQIFAAERRCEGPRQSTKEEASRYALQAFYFDCNGWGHGLHGSGGNAGCLRMGLFKGIVDGGELI
jgi:hypothetical protein